jgi:hypothetical protein
MLRSDSCGLQDQMQEAADDREIADRIHKNVSRRRSRIENREITRAPTKIMGIHLAILRFPYAVVGWPLTLVEHQLTARLDGGGT